MDDRELIARLIDPVMWNPRFNNPDYTGSVTDLRRTSLRKADAVLAALGDRLLPELPEWVKDIDIHQSLVSGRWEASLDEGFPADQNRFVEGTGPTIAAAIRAALEVSDE